MRDVIVIGEVGGGAVVAKELAAQGLDVFVLEAGPAAKPERDDPVECVDKREQQPQAREARERWRAETQRAWGAARSSILDGVASFKANGRLDRKLASDLRLVERGVRALDRDVLGH